MTKLVAICCLLAMTGCAGAPVQEMSDARQAVRAAQAAGADEHAPDAMAEARRLIDEAQQQLQYHEYRKAQRTAIDAREQALQALKTARQAGTSGQ